MAEAVSIAEALDLLKRGAGPLDAAPTADDAPVAKRAARRARRGIALNLTPMIDVTFLLLVFFVCTT